MKDGAILKEEVICLLDIKENGLYIDATAGEGFLAEVILEKLKTGKLFLFDIDEGVCEKLREKFAGRKNVEIFNESYTDIPKFIKEQADGIIFDFGVGTHQLKSGSGFSFTDSNLDMRYSKKKELTAEKLINTFPEEKIAEILFKYGEEYAAKKIAAAICALRKQKPIKSALELSDVVSSAVPDKWKKGKHPATKTFQALRIFVNSELENVEKTFSFIPEILKKGGRAVFLCYHSLEDRIVKNKIKELEKSAFVKNLTKKAVKAGRKDILQQRRARSVRARAVEKK